VSFGNLAPLSRHHHRCKQAEGWIHKAEGSLGRPAGASHHDLELAVRASHWLGSSLL
jgi:hypothetical protein